MLFIKSLIDSQYNIATSFFVDRAIMIWLQSDAAECRGRADTSSDRKYLLEVVNALDIKITMSLATRLSPSIFSRIDLFLPHNYIIHLFKWILMSRLDPRSDIDY